jgi:formamidopyrimidine-DNA glycosylase
MTELNINQFIIHFSISCNSPPEDDTLVAFLDPRRLGRIRLVSSPTQDPPISNLGFDPVLRMLPLSEFSTLLLKRTCPIKALLLDQSFSAGVGNWVADEILYHARVHPEQRCSTMSREQVEAVWKWTEEVPKTAVSLNADDKKFPEDWLFKHRWVGLSPILTRFLSKEPQLTSG